MVVRGCSRALLILAALLGAGPGLGSVRIEERDLLVLRVEVLKVRRGASETLASRTMELDDGRKRLDVNVPWAPLPEPGQLAVWAVGHATGEELHPVHVSTELRIAGRTFKAARSLAMRPGSSYLLEAFAHEGERLLLSVSAEIDRRHVVVGPGEIGDPIAFRLEVDRVLADRQVLLETNYLNTFVGQPVEYSFRRGYGDDLESLLLRLRPVVIRGEVAEVVFELSGELPGQPQRLELDRSEKLFTSRGATSSIEATVGQPPSGYRFRVTPSF